MAFMRAVLGPAIFLLLGLGTLVVCVVLGVSTANLLLTGTSAQATIASIDVERQTQRSGNRTTTSTTYTTHLAVGGAECIVGGRFGETGQVVAVRHAAGDPSSCVVDSLDSLVGLGVGASMGLLFTVLGAFFVHRTVRAQRA